MTQPGRECVRQFVVLHVQGIAKVVELREVAKVASVTIERIGSSVRHADDPLTSLLE